MKKSSYQKLKEKIKLLELEKANLILDVECLITHNNPVREAAIRQRFTFAKDLENLVMYGNRSNENKNGGVFYFKRHPNTKITDSRDIKFEEIIKILNKNE